MKVKYIKEHIDGKYIFPAGCVAEHAEGDGNRVIALGVAVQVDDNARAFRYKPDAPLAIDVCVPPEPPPIADAPLFKGARAIK